MISCFIEHEDSIYNYKPEVYQTRRSTVEVKDPAGTSTGKAVYYRIKMEIPWEELPLNMVSVSTSFDG